MDFLFIMSRFLSELNIYQINFPLNFVYLLHPNKPSILKIPNGGSLMNWYWSTDQGLYADHNLLTSYCLSVLFLSFSNTIFALPTPQKIICNLQNDSNFQAVAHIKIILQKPNTSLATEMRKMALTPITFSFLPTLPLPHRNVHLLTVTQSV